MFDSYFSCMNSKTITQIEYFLRLANTTEYTRKHAARLIDKMGGVNIKQIDYLISNLDFIINKNHED